MVDKKLAECSSKKGVKILLTHNAFKKDDLMAELVNVWDIIRIPSTDDSITNIVGTKEEVTRLAQEAFGFDPEDPNAWEVRSSQTTIKSVIDAKDLLDDLNIPGTPVYQKES